MFRKFRAANIVLFILFFTLFFSPSAQAAPLRQEIEQIPNTFLDSLETLGRSSQLGTLKKWAKDQWGISSQFYFKTKMDYSDNVFGQPPRDRYRADIIWTETPGGLLSVNFPKGKASVSYEADVKLYTKFNHNAHTDHSFAASLDLAPVDNMYLQITESLNHRGTPGNNQFSEEVIYLQNSSTVTTGYKMGRLTPEFDYSSYLIKYDFDQQKFLNYHEDKFTLRLYYDLLEKLKIYPAYVIAPVDYVRDDRRDAYYHEVLAGLVGELPWQIQASATFGENFRFQKSELHKDWNSIVASVSLKKQIFPKTVMETAFSRRPAETSFDEQAFSLGKFYYLGFIYSHSQALRLRTNVSYTNRDYKEFSTIDGIAKRRDDKVIKFNTGIDKVLREWLIWKIDYIFTRQNSNISDFDMRENRLETALTILL